MWTVIFRRDWNDVQPRAEKRANKFAGCQVNVEREIREFTINVGAQEIFGSPPHPPWKIGHFLVRLNGTSVVERHAARMFNPGVPRW